MDILKCSPDIRMYDGSIGHLNVHWTLDLSSGFNGRMKCPMDIRLGLHGGGSIMPYDVLWSSTACWLKTRVLVIGICPLGPMDPLDTRMSIGHLTSLLDRMGKSNVQWTIQMPNRHFDWVFMNLCSESFDL